MTLRLSEPGALVGPGLGRPPRGYQPATGRPLRRLSIHVASGLRQHRRLDLRPPGPLASVTYVSAITQDKNMYKNMVE